jgi:HEPN domain-containing protein
MGQTGWMLFRLTNEVRDYELADRDRVRVEVGGPHQLVVVLRQEPVKRFPFGSVFLDVTAEFEPPPAAGHALHDLAKRLVPDGSKLEDDLAPKIRDRQLPARSRGLYFCELPDALREFSSQLGQELSKTAIEILRLVRWRRAMTGPADALWWPQIAQFEWANNPEHWHKFAPASKTSLRYSITESGLYLAPPMSTPDEIIELEDMAASGIREPLAHALFREAQRASAQREYASALVMAIAALEIGVKQLIGALAPAAEWFALNAPSPPMIKILKNYLPTIPAHESIGGNVASPPPRF